MNWQYLVGLRYLTSKRKEKFISLISLISMAGIALGVAALIIVIAVMSGFDNDLKDKMIGTNAHVIVHSEFGMTPSQETIDDIRKTAHVASCSFFVTGQALIRKNDTVTGVLVKGIVPDGESKVNKIASYISSGSLNFGDDGIVVGSQLADKLNLAVGDELVMISSAFQRGKTFRVCGIFTSGMYEYDATLVYVDLAAAEALFGVKDLASGISVKVDDAFNAAEVKRALAKKFGPPVVVQTWMDMNKNLLSALKLEKTVMFIILTLIVLVACFNIASSLIMTVLEKTKDIGILKAIGASNLDIMAIFAMQGAMIGVVGTALGVGLGAGLSYLLKTYKFISLPKDIYYIDKLPVNLAMQDISLIVASSLLICLIATIYPAYKASRLDPVEALRYE